MVRVAGFSPTSIPLEEGCLIYSSHTRKNGRTAQSPTGVSAFAKLRAVYLHYGPKLVRWPGSAPGPSASQADTLLIELRT